MKKLDELTTEEKEFIEKMIRETSLDEVISDMRKLDEKMNRLNIINHLDTAKQALNYIKISLYNN